MLPDRVDVHDTQSNGSPGTQTSCPGPRTCATASCAPPPPASPAPALPPRPPIVDFRPGRAGGMLPNGSALAAATARALDAVHGSSDPEDDSSSDGEDSAADYSSSLDDDDAYMPSSDDDQLGHAATELPARAGYTAVAAAPLVTVSTAATVSVPRTWDDRLGWQADMLPDRVGYDERFSGVDGAMPIAVDVDMAPDDSQRVALSAQGPALHPTPPVTGQQDPVVSVYAHNAPAFRCTLCAYTACDMTALASHRRTAHRGTCFVDHFHSGCTCGIGHRTRAAATKHALAVMTACLTHLLLHVSRPGRRPLSLVPCGLSRTQRGDPSPTGPLSAVMSAAAGVASSHTATADITTFQSTVHTTSRLPVHPHVPPVRYISASQAHIRVAGKRRRLNDDDPIPGDPDWDMETHDQQVERTVQANLMTLDTGITSRLDSFRSSLDTDVASPTVDVAVSGCPVTDDAPTSTPAVQRPLASAAVRTRATRAIPPPAPPPTPPRPRDVPSSPVVEDVQVSGDTKSWLLQFDGACRRNPGAGGAGAVLSDSAGTVVWTGSHFLPSPRETNNSAEYAALLMGVKSAVLHGATRLMVEGDSTLVMAQVRGSFNCSNRRLRSLRSLVRLALADLQWYKLRHIDRQANAHADRLANRALDQRKTSVVCGPHSYDMSCCFEPRSSVDTNPAMVAHSAPTTSAGAAPISDSEADVEADIAARDGAAATALQSFADSMASRITDADSWITGEGYISAIPNTIRDILLPFCSTAAAAHPGGSAPSRRERRPPRVTRTQREHRLDEALDDMQAVQSTTPADQRAVRRARRRVGRVRASMQQLDLRRAFGKDEARCVANILDGASVETAGIEHPDTCPISRQDLHQHFVGVNTPPTRFNFDAECGQEFRATLTSFSRDTVGGDCFDVDITLDEVEDQLLRATKTSSPGHDGVGYDVFSRFALQLVPLLHAAFQFCWLHRMVPALWKVGMVRLIHKKR
ncbi:unnamed protein product [Peronospora destructor]|uniref:RNase H type-1 domain-containing protein n=1 Tax=Peronospora destructor TaxID=86335 RepID=A0AAV0UF29_9STRA|nr:unnamed protein product [Peronospora destructor]